MPDKTLNQIPPAFREQYRKGVAALERQNLDYAITILTGVLDQEPAFFDCRQALRVSQHKKSGAGGGFFKKMISVGSSSPMIAKGQLALRNSPQEALSIAEQVLNGDANSTAGHKLAAEAALALELPKTALISLEILAKASPKDEDIAKKLAAVYADLGQADKAEKIYVELIRQRPNDPSLNEELKNLSARKTMSEGGYDALSGGNGSYRDVLKDKNQSVALEQENRQVKSEDVAQRLIGEYETRLTADPTNLKIMRSLAELCVQKNEFDRALEYYNRIGSVSGTTDSALRKSIADTSLKKFEHSLTLLDPQAADYAEQAAQIKAMRDSFVLDECKQRVEAYPNDLQIRFEMGILYFNAGKIGEAIQEFQKAQNNPHRRIQSLGYLGQCFGRRNMNDLAARTLQSALKEKLVFDDEKKDLIYALGCVLEKMAKKEEAIEQFKQIYEVDISYRDVSAKVDAYYAGQ